ncbi:Kinesin-like protein kif2a [Entophlyctis sp. JEL0112]|nr:Kinesin-like protein kif2a [Entophlyctis sp. JEL0112]
MKTGANSAQLSLTTPSKTAVEIARLKDARDSRRAAAAALRVIEKQMSQSEKESKIYRDEIANFRNQIRNENLRSDSANSGDLMNETRIKVCVRKRPLNCKDRNVYDIVTARNGRYPQSLIYIHEPKARVDQSKFIDTHSFTLDYTFDETSTNQQVYLATGKPLVRGIFEGGMCTFFAYGQTGSGKTHTIFGSPNEPGLYTFICEEIFSQMASISRESDTSPKFSLVVSFFEIYGQRINDLLQPGTAASPAPQIQLCEDKNGAVVLMNLQEVRITTLADLLALVARGRSQRTTRATRANGESSRSHALVQMRVVSGEGAGVLHGALSLVDLAGSERGVDTQLGTRKNDKKIQIETAEINKSLLSLKECIRALHRRGLSNGQSVEDVHIPFRGSKLTHILRDSFLSKHSQTVMIATISPGSDCVEHTLNTLRYADRVKELGQSASNELIQKQLSKSVERQSTPTSGLKIHIDLRTELTSNLKTNHNSKDAMTTQRRELNNFSDWFPLSIPNADQEITLKDKQSSVTIIKLPADQHLAQRKQDFQPVTNPPPEEECYEAERDSQDYFYQDTLSVESESTAESNSESTEGNSDGGENEGPAESQSDVNSDSDKDASEWRRYCAESRNQQIPLYHSHMIDVQQQFLELENLLLDRFRSGRMGYGAYVTQLSELLNERIKALRE